MLPSRAFAPKPRGAIPGGESDDNDELDELDSEQLEVAQQALYADWSERASLL